MRFFLSFFFAVLISSTAWAQERITNFDVTIDVDKSGDLLVTEDITIQDAPGQSRRGIFRELYANYEFMGVKQDYEYELISIKREGKSESFSRQTNDGAVLWRIGNRDIYLPNGTHNYEIKYRVSDQARRHLDGGVAVKDEIYWNATGTFWPYPIEKASATIIFPKGAEIIEQYAYTGRRGASESNYAAEKRDNVVGFETTRILQTNEGLSVAASINPGVIDPMSAERIQQLNWIRKGGPILLGLGGLGLFVYYITMWGRVGRDPQKLPVFARYEPPKGYSPAAVHHIHHKGFKKMDALTSTLMSLSMKDVLDIHATKKKTTLTSMLMNRDSAALLEDERYLLDLFFGNRDGKIVMDKTTDTSFYKKVSKFTRYISKNYGRSYHRSNAGWGLLGMAISIAIIIFVMNQPVSTSGPIFLAILGAIAAMNILFFILLRAPTKRGAQITSEIDGFKLYLETAEKDRINTANPLGDRPPMMTVELYERFMPYAVALGAEKPWTKQFETTLPIEAKNYEPNYAHGSLIDSKGGVPWKMSDALATAMTAGVAAAAPVSQSSSSGGFSSGSSGGGFSGGGSGGGGGGSW
ncbi:DUF2207 domain-containing protein [Hellea balneolensis]|uniref:DUF2207 domain-containing protein n=1 Tax=Hellea balneolensis TaxID=287478 RepID=UPI000421CA7F|nr:DUF2207 domain-containing protein [Hellea balneolensis]